MTGEEMLLLGFGVVAFCLYAASFYLIGRAHGFVDARSTMMEDVTPPGWTDEALEMYADNGAVATPGDKPWPYNKICVRPGRCLIDHSPCNGFPRVEEWDAEE